MSCCKVQFEERKFLTQHDLLDMYKNESREGWNLFHMAAKTHQV